MQTWLDWYIKGYRDTVPGVFDESVSDIDAAYLSIGSMMSEGYRDPDKMQRILEMQADTVLLQMLMLPFLAKHSGYATETDRKLPTLAIRPATDLVRSLMGGKPNEEIINLATKIKADTNLYIDIPNAELAIDDKNRVRAIFISEMSMPGTPPTVDSARDTLTACIFTDKHTNKMAGRLLWDGNNAVIGSPVSTETPLESIIAQVNDFIALLLAYREHAEDAYMAMLPQYKASDLKGKKPKKAAAIAKKKTLFQVIDLRPPKDRFGKSKSDDAVSRPGWKLGHKVEVRGYFRLQPYGPGRKLRKLKWIKPHTRGEGQEKAKLELL